MDLFSGGPPLRGVGGEHHPLRRQRGGHRYGRPQFRGQESPQAVLWGAAGAVVVRLLFAAVIAFLLHVPLLQVVGGVLLIWIAWQLVRDGGEEEGDGIQAGQSAWDAIKIIIVADIVMSLDNVRALVQAARVDREVSYVVLGIGLITTVPLVVFGAALLTGRLNRFPLLVYFAAALFMLLAWMWARKTGGLVRDQKADE